MVLCVKRKSATDAKFTLWQIIPNIDDMKYYVRKCCYTQIKILTNLAIWLKTIGVYFQRHAFNSFRDITLEGKTLSLVLSLK